MAARMRLLVVEDEQRLAAGLRKGLEAEGFAVDVVNNGTDGITIRALGAAMHEPGVELLRQITDDGDVPETWRDWAQRRLARAG